MRGVPNPGGFTAIRRAALVVVFSLSAAMSWSVLSATIGQARHNCDHPEFAYVYGGMNPDTNGRGVRVALPGMEVFNSSVQCTRLSGISLIGTQGQRAVEMGWDEDPNGYLEGDCEPTTGSPKAFTVVYDFAVTLCQRHGGLTAGDFPDFEIHDADQNSVWKFFKNGTSVRQYDFGNFNSGDVYASGERNNEADSARANHDGLYRMNASQQWVAWGSGTDTIVVVADTDDYPPDFQGCPTESDQFQVKDTC